MTPSYQGFLWAKYMEMQRVMNANHSLPRSVSSFLPLIHSLFWWQAFQCNPGSKQKRSFSTNSFRNLTTSVVRFVHFCSIFWINNQYIHNVVSFPPKSQSLQIPLHDVLNTADEQIVEISIESKVVLFTKHVDKKGSCWKLYFAVESMLNGLFSI